MLVATLQRILKKLIGSTSVIRTVSLFEIKKEFRRNSLGPLWLWVQHGLYLWGIAALSSAVFRQPIENRVVEGGLGYLGYLLMSGPVLDSPRYLLRFRVLGNSIGGVLSRVAAGLLVHLIHFAISMLMIFPLSAGVSALIDAGRLLKFLLVLVATVPLLTGVSSTLALMNCRFRDIDPLVQAIGRIWFLSLPVFWSENLIPQSSAAYRVLIEFNPFGATVVLVRDALLDRDLQRVLLTQLLCYGALSLALAAVVCRRLIPKVKSLLVMD